MLALHGSGNREGTGPSRGPGGVRGETLRIMQKRHAEVRPLQNEEFNFNGDSDEHLT